MKLQVLKNIFIKQIIWMMKNSRFVDNTNDQDTIAIISMVVATKHQKFFQYNNKIIWNNVITYHYIENSNLSYHL